jgi:anti-anti-sigma factor
MERGLTAPETLGLDTRVEIRKAAFAVLEQMPEGAGRLVIDFARTRHVDSAGLGALMLIQRQAAERRQVVALRHVNDELRFLLVLTKLADLFDLEPSVA